MSFLNPPASDVRRRRIIAGGASVILTTIVMTGFMLESRWGYSGKVMNVIYMQSWSADRTRAEAKADGKATIAAQEARMAQSRAYIATLTGKAKIDAQKQYDKYVEGDGAEKEIPYIRAVEPPVR